jgi:hypothetical protein
MGDVQARMTVNSIIKAEASDIMNNIAVHCPQILQNHLVEMIGETVERQGTRVKRIAAKEIIKRDPIPYYPKDSQDLMMAAVEIVELNYRLASPSTHFSAELEREVEPYSTDGMLFPAVVHTVRIEDDLFAWSWLPEQVRALGLAMNPGEDIAWPITREYVTLQDRDGNCRPVYRVS